MSKMTSSTRAALAIAGVCVLAIAFWFLLLAPKRDKADELATQVNALQGEVESEKQRVETGLAAKRAFPADYQQLILLGKAVPAEAATPSLLVQLNGVSAGAETSFNAIELEEGKGGDSEGEEAVSLAVAPTEAAASQLPIGAAVGPAGLPALPYKLEFNGGYFDIANFLEGLDSFVETKNGMVDANGRLVTINSFELTPLAVVDEQSILISKFNVTTYSTPPGEGLTAGATEAGPAPAPPSEVPTSSTP